MVTLSFIGLIILVILFDQLFMKGWEKPQPDHHEHHGEPESGGGDIVLPKGYHLHPGHSWAHPMKDGKVAVGVDDVVQSAVGPVGSVTLPTKGASLEAGDVAFRLVVGGRELEIVAPVSGVVASVNDDLTKRPGLINSDPYGYGWVMALQPAGGSDISLPADDSAVEWLTADVARLREFVQKYRGGEALGSMLRGANDIAWSMFQDGFLTPGAEKEA